LKQIAFCLLLLEFQLLAAQSPEWSDGSLVLANNEVVVGRIVLHEKHDLLLFERNGSKTVYNSHQIKSAYYYDKAADINRRYIAMKTEDGERSRYQLYEIVVSGDVHVLRRKKASALSTHTNAVDYNYFTLHNGVLSPLIKFPKTMLSELNARSEGSLERFISANRLRVNQAPNSIRIIKYYNALARKGEPVAMN
jgi:hypothetical protein